MVCLAVHEKWVIDADAIWLVAGLVVLLASVSGNALVSAGGSCVTKFAVCVLGNADPSA